MLLLWCLVELSEGLVELRQEVGISGVGSEGHVRRRLLESSGQHRGFVACWRGGVSRFVLWGPVGRPRRRGRCSVACAETWGTSLCIRSWGLDDRARGALSSTSGGVNRVVLVSRDLGWVSARSPGLDTLASLRGSTSGGGEGSGVCGRDPGVGSQRMVTGSRRSGAGRPQLDQRRGERSGVHGQDLGWVPAHGHRVSTRSLRFTARPAGVMGAGTLGSTSGMRGGIAVLNNSLSRDATARTRSSRRRSARPPPDFRGPPLLTAVR